MSRYEDRIDPVFERLSAAQRATGGAMTLKGKTTEQQEILNRIDSSLAFVDILIRQGDAALVSAGRIGQIQAISDEIRAAVEGFNPQSAPNLEAADQATDRLLDSAAGQPHREIEVAADRGKHVAKSFQRSARARERGLRNEIRKARAEATAIATRLESAKEELAATVESRSQALEQRAAAVEQQLGAVEQSQSQLSEQQTNDFTQSQERRDSEVDAWRSDQSDRVKSQLEDAESRLNELISNSQTSVDEFVEELGRKDNAAEELVGSISIRGTADRYEKEATAQSDIANKWRMWTVVIGLLAGVAAGSAAFFSDQEPGHIAGKLALGLLLAGVAGYTARQSAQHRLREEHARKLHLDLAAFGPFIEPLSEEAKNQERILLGRRVFAQEARLTMPREDGTSVAGLLPRRTDPPPE